MRKRGRRIYIHFSRVVYVVLYLTGGCGWRRLRSKASGTSHTEGNRVAYFLWALEIAAASSAADMTYLKIE